MESIITSRSDFVETPQYAHCRYCLVERKKGEKGAYAYTCCNCGAPFQLAIANPACYECGHYFKNPQYRRLRRSHNNGDVDPVNNVVFNNLPKRREVPPREPDLRSNVDTAGPQLLGNSAQNQNLPLSNMSDASQVQSSNPTDSESENEQSDSDRQTNSTSATTPMSIDAHERSHFLAPSIIQSVMDRVMRSAHFTSSLQEFTAGIRRVVDHTTSGRNSTDIEASTTTDPKPGEKSSRTNVKHSMPENHHVQEDDEGNDEDDDSDDNQRVWKRPKFDDTGRKRHRKLACPFFRFDPEAFADCNSCSGVGYSSISRLKEHLDRKHSLVQCQRCYKLLKSETCLIKHIREPIECRMREPRQLDPRDGITEAQKKKLRRRAGLCKLSEVEKWQAIYMILFPDTDPQRIPPAYRNENALSNDFDAFEDFCKRELESVVRERITQHDKETLDPLIGKGDLDEKAQSLIIDLLKSATNELLCRFRGKDGASTSTSDSQFKSTEGVGGTAGYLGVSHAGISTLDNENEIEDAFSRHLPASSNQPRPISDLPDINTELFSQQPREPREKQWGVFGQDESSLYNFQLNIQENMQSEKELSSYDNKSLLQSEFHSAHLDYEHKPRTNADAKFSVSGDPQEDEELWQKWFNFDFDSENLEASITGSAPPSNLPLPEIDVQSMPLANRWHPPSQKSYSEQQSGHDISDMLEEELEGIELIEL